MRGQDQLLVDIVHSTYDEFRIADIQKKYAEFAETIWRASDIKDIRVLMTVVTAYLPERRDRAIRLLYDYIDTASEPLPAAVVRLIDLLRADPGPRDSNGTGRSVSNFQF